MINLAQIQFGRIIPVQYERETSTQWVIDGIRYRKDNGKQVGGTGQVYRLEGELLERYKTQRQADKYEMLSHLHTTQYVKADGGEFNVITGTLDNPRVEKIDHSYNQRINWFDICYSTELLATMALRGKLELEFAKILQRVDKRIEELSK